MQQVCQEGAAVAKKLNVPESVLAEAKDCPSKFSCLSTGKCGDEPQLCEVESANGKNVLFLSLKERKECPFHVPFADGLLCTCPVRYWTYGNEGHEGCM